MRHITRCTVFDRVYLANSHGHWLGAWSGSSWQAGKGCGQANVQSNDHAIA